MALGGFEYQRAFALWRLAALALQQPLTAGAAVPVLLRYEWAEDIDEVCADGLVLLWQCKHGDGWHSPAPLADVLLGFAAKWLWTTADQRHRLVFRLVTSDRAFAAHHDLPGPLPDIAKVGKAFTDRLGERPGEHSDRALWQADADAVGHATLFQALFHATAILYMPGTLAAGQTHWESEQRAVDALARARFVVDAGRAAEVVQALRPLLDTQPHRAPDTLGCLDRAALPPRWFRRHEVQDRLLPFSTNYALARLPAFDRTRLQQMLVEVRGRPMWPAGQNGVTWCEVPTTCCSFLSEAARKNYTTA